MDHLYNERAWMYQQRIRGRPFNDDAWVTGVVSFINDTTARGYVSEDGSMRCPCRKCRNRKFHHVQIVEEHLFRSGFIPNYYNWTLHGEKPVDVVSDAGYNDGHGPLNPEDALQTDASEYREPGVVYDSNFAEMVYDVGGPSSVRTATDDEQHIPYNEGVTLNNLWRSSREPAFEGCATESELSITMKLLQNKTDHHWTENAFDSICNMTRNLLGRENKVPSSFRNAKKLIADLGMSKVRIDVCVEGCMIYYKEHENLLSCLFCGEARFQETRGGEKSGGYQRIARKSMFYLPIIPRLQRLFLTPGTAEHMSWHATHGGSSETMVHPSDGGAWKHFNHCYPEFASDPRNVRLGLCSDGFTPFGMSAKSYSCWPVMVTPYNLPPWMCMKSRYIWLTLLIPGPTNPKKRIDIYLKPLVDDLLILWSSGVETYDAHLQNNFVMKAALMWTISDFPAFGMLSGWSTAGRLGCPYCMESSKTFWLANGRKQSYFDCHRRFLPTDHPHRHDYKRFYKNRVEHDPPIEYPSGHDVYNRVRHLKYAWEQLPDESVPGYGDTHNWTKKSVFWLLPYWANQRLRHNLDVMHIEKNVFENLFNTIMDIKGKSKDNGLRCREDVKLYCNRPELQVVSQGRRRIGGRAKYQLTVEQQLAVLNWIKTLQFPDGYGSRLGRHVDLRARKLVGYKSHDAHVFLERLMAIAFRGFLPGPVWEGVAELATFFKDICASSLDVQRMRHWKVYIVETLCKLEICFPPSFFDSMEHLPVHLAEEMLLGGPVHYRWMYPFERFIFRLKKTATNKSRPEAAIVNAYINQEVAFLGADYLGPEFITNARRAKRNEVLSNPLSYQISIFNYLGKAGAIQRKKDLSAKEYAYATYFILTNTPELQSYLEEFQTHTRTVEGNLSEQQAREYTVREFPTWLQRLMLGEHGAQDIPSWLVDVGNGFNSRVSSYGTYKVNNYRFNTESHSEGRATVNCQVHVKGDGENHFYGVIEEIIELHTRRNKNLSVVLFSCRWFDPRHVKVFPAHGVTEVNTRRIYKQYDPFILAQQADQVYYTQFPGLPKKSAGGCVAACRIKPTNTIDMKATDVPYQDEVPSDTELPVVTPNPGPDGLAFENSWVVYGSEDEGGSEEDENDLDDDVEDEEDSIDEACTDSD